MKYIRENELLFKKYGVIIILNIIFYILCNFYFKSSDTGTVIMLLIVLISNLIIYNYKEKTKFKYYLDIITNIIIGLILLLFIKDEFYYSTILISLFLGNNIVFMRSRISEKFLMRSLQYLLSFLLTMFCMFICLCLLNIIY